MFYIAHVSLAFIVVLFIAIARVETKNQIRKYFMAFMVELFVWTISVLAQQYCVLFGQTQHIMFFEKLAYFGVAFIPAQVMLISMAATSSGPKSLTKRFVFFIIPIVTQVVIWANDLHGAFYMNYTFPNVEDVEFGWYFYIHSAYSYACLLGAILLIIRFVYKNRGSGDSNAQMYILLVGIIVPILVNILYTIGVSGFTAFSTPVAFLVTVLAYFFGMYRYNMIRLTPIAMKMVMNKASDLYIVIDEDMVILDYNEPFYDVFSPLISIKKQTSLAEALSKMNKTGIPDNVFIDIVRECQDSRETIYRDFNIESGGEVKHYTAEFSALLIDNEYHGCIMLLRNITRAVNDMEEIKQNHIRLIEQEHLASLGQLIGGIAHNLKTPIMAMSGRTKNLEALIEEYEESVGDEKVSAEDHIEIANDMKKEVFNIQSHISYISEIITTVKEQTIKFDEDNMDMFTVSELVRRVQILMHHELICSNCELIYDEQIDDSTIINGDINAIVQVVDNIIINSMNAYGGKPGKIWLTIYRAHEDVIISIKDKAGGIPADIQEKLFKQMVTTKGKGGTGLGLYISYSTVVGRYGGEMWFKTTPGQGSEFFVMIPLEKRKERGIGKK